MQSLNSTFFLTLQEDMYAQQLKAVSIVQDGHSLYIGGQPRVEKSYLVKQTSAADL